MVKKKKKKQKNTDPNKCKNLFVKQYIIGNYQVVIEKSIDAAGFPQIVFKTDVNQGMRKAEISAGQFHSRQEWNDAFDGIDEAKAADFLELAKSEFKS